MLPAAAHAPRSRLVATEKGDLTDMPRRRRDLPAGSHRPIPGSPRRPGGRGLGRLPWSVLLLTLLVAPPTGAQGSSQEPAGGAPPVEIGAGLLADPVVVAQAPELSYALYLPEGYRADRSWPVLFLFEPEGRGAALAERFREGADRWGFVLVASNDVVRDTPWEINQRVVQLLLSDSFRHAVIDSTRLHFGGLGGTARVAWAAGEGFRDAVGGVVLMGGTTPDARQPDEAPPYPVYLVTSDADFNHDEVRRLAQTLDELGGTERLHVFEGPHGPPPQPVATRALTFFHLRAVAEGSIEGDPERLSALLQRDLERAEALEAEGDLLAAAERWEAVARDWREVVAEDDPRLRRARRRAEELASRREVRRARRELRSHMRTAEIYRADVAAAIHRLRSDRKPPQPARLVADLKIRHLQEMAAQTEDPEQARAARRMLELAFVHTSYYLPPELMARDHHRRAASSLTVAAAIHPEDPEVWLRLARAYALAGERKEAFEALREAVATGLEEPERVLEMEAFAPWREEAELLGIVTSSGSASGTAAPPPAGSPPGYGWTWPAPAGPGCAGSRASSEPEASGSWGCAPGKRGSRRSGSNVGRPPPA